MRRRRRQLGSRQACQEAQESAGDERRDGRSGAEARRGGESWSENGKKRWECNLPGQG